jgi:hypothetical protein
LMELMDIALDISLKHPVYLQQWGLSIQFSSHIIGCESYHFIRKNLTEGDGEHG